MFLIIPVVVLITLSVNVSSQVTNIENALKSGVLIQFLSSTHF